MGAFQAEIGLVIVFFSKEASLAEKCFSQHRPVWLHFLSLSSPIHVVIRPTKWPWFTGGLP